MSHSPIRHILRSQTINLKIENLMSDEFLQNFEYVINLLDTTKFIIKYFV